MRQQAISFGFLVVLALAQSAQGATLIDTGAGSTNTVGGTALFNSGTSHQFVAGQITLPNAATIQGFSGWMTGSGTLDFNIYANGANNLPGAKLGGATGPVASSGITPEWKDSPAMSVPVPAGTYWVGFEAPAGYSGTLPNGAPNPLARYAFFSDGNANWVNLGTRSHGFRVVGIVVPEPTTLAAFTLVRSLLLRRRK